VYLLVHAAFLKPPACVACAFDAHDMAHEDAGRDDGLGVERAELDDLVHAGHGALAAVAITGAEVARGLAVGQVAPAVAALGLDEGHVAEDGVLQHVGGR
jgi:hypothetical protein